MACIQPVYTKHSTLGATQHDTQLPYRLYLAAYTRVPSHWKCVQQVKGLWKIYPTTIEARNKLLESGIMFKKHKITLLDRDPFLPDKIPLEKIIFRDVLLDVPDDEVIQFIFRCLRHFFIEMCLDVTRSRCSLPKLLLSCLCFYPCVAFSNCFYTIFIECNVVNFYPLNVIINYSYVLC